jgi:hypothetical protein
MGGGEFDSTLKIFLSLILSAPPAGFWERLTVQEITTHENSPRCRVLDPDVSGLVAQDDL